MKAITINFTGENGGIVKTYSTVSIKTGLVDRIFDLAEMAQKLEKENTGVAEVREFFSELKALVVALFGGQFTFDELQTGVEQAELMRCFTSACKAITSELGKNA